MECYSAWLQHVLGDSEHVHCTPVHDIDVAAIVNKHFAASDLNYWPEQDRVNHQCNHPDLASLSDDHFETS
jgi:hypothetical protein